MKTRLGLPPVFRTVSKGSIPVVYFGFKFNGTEISKTGVESGVVVEGLDVVKDGSARLGAGGEAAMIDQLVFEAAPKRLDKGVIVTVAWTAHRSHQPMLGQELPVSGAGKLAPAIGVDDERSLGPTLV